MEHPESTTLTSPDATGTPAEPAGPAVPPATPPVGGRPGASIAVVIGVVVSLVLAMAGILGYQSLSGELDDRDDEINALEQTIAELETNLADAAADRTQLQSDVEANQVAIDAAGTRADSLEAQTARLEAVIAGGVGGGDRSDTVTEVAAPSPVGGLPPLGANGEPDAAIGMAVPDISGTDFLTGDTVSIATDSPALIMVWAHWCPYCQRELPMLQQLHEEGLFDEKGIQLLTIATFEDETRGNPFEDYVTEFTFPVIRDELDRAGLLGVSAVPSWLVVASDGSVLGRFSGAIGEEALRVVVDQIAELGR